jgi:hypothetical protein
MNMTPPNEWSDEEINAEMAMLMGWTQGEGCPGMDKHIWEPFWTRPWPADDGIDHDCPEERQWTRTPNYCKSGNLMLEVMGWLDDNDADLFISRYEIEEVLGNGEPCGKMIHRVELRADDDYVKDIREFSLLPRALSELTILAWQKGWVKGENDG